jgi:hypothetical protein
VTSILVTDTHLTDRPTDEYRWGLWPWLREQVKKVQADELIHLGDLTDAKDRHPSRLVNRLVESTAMVTDLCRLYFLKGNHDYIDPLNPFFAFVGTHPKTSYIKTSSVVELSIGKATFVPAGEKWDFQLHDFPFCFAHVTFDGAEAENGSLLPGVDPARLKDYQGMVYSGDIHVPQKVRKNIEYVGAPYHIRFGDTYAPRILVVYNNGKTNELHYPAPRKCVFNLDSVKRLDDLVADEGDHVRIRYLLRRSNYDTWHETREVIRQHAAKKGWVLFGIEGMPIEATKPEGNRQRELLTPDELFENYVKRHKLNEEYVRVGRQLLIS